MCQPRKNRPALPYPTISASSTSDRTSLAIAAKRKDGLPSQFVIPSQQLKRTGKTQTQLGYRFESCIALQFLRPYFRLSSRIKRALWDFPYQNSGYGEMTKKLVPLIPFVTQSRLSRDQNVSAPRYCCPGLRIFRFQLSA